jgi:hypothetical protein
VVAQAIEERVEALDALDRFGAKSKMTQADVDEIAAKIDRRMAKHFSRLLAKSSSAQTKP